MGPDVYDCVEFFYRDVKWAVSTSDDEILTGCHGLGFDPVIPRRWALPL